MKRFFLGLLAAAAALVGLDSPGPVAPAAEAAAHALDGPQVGVIQHVANTPAPAQPAAAVVVANQPLMVTAPMLGGGGFFRFRGVVERRKVRYGRTRWIVLG